MADFAQAEFALSARQEDGASLRDHLLSAYDQTGVLDPQIAEAPPLPPATGYLWAHWRSLDGERHYTDHGLPQRLRSLDIGAWAALRRVRLDPWELDAILALERAFFASIKPKK